MEKETKQEKKNNEQAAIEREKAERKRIKKSIYITIFINVAVSLLITALGLLWQKSLTILAWSNAMLLTLIMIFLLVGLCLYTIKTLSPYLPTVLKCLV
jgi:FtsH-binding integral membrane protein